MIVQRLRAIQDEYGFLPEKELVALAAATGTPLYRIQEVASFFAHFRPEWDKPPYVHVQVCRDYTCHHRGADRLLGPHGLGSLARGGDKPVVVEGVSCLGRCDRARVVCVSRHDHVGHGCHEYVYAGRGRSELVKIVQAIIDGHVPLRPDRDRDYQPHANKPIDPAIEKSRYQIDVYAQKPELEPYQASRNFLAKHPQPIAPPDRPKDLNKWVEANHPMLWELFKAGLLGMGGAGVPAFRKWLDVWTAAEPEKYIVCNGDESEPGTFKDRELLLRHPHLVVEGVILAGLFTNATAGYIFIRHEYPEQVEAVRAEIARAEAFGVCGENLLKTGRNFPVDVFVSPGGYICGEQSALLEAMSDRRAQPRNRPPELATNGLRDKPTVVNNVETLAWSPAVMLNGGEWYATASTGGLKGRRLFSISGDLARPGVYEVPISATLGELINDYAGGVARGRGVMAVATSGPSGGLLPRFIPVPPDDVLNARIAEQLADKKQSAEEFRRESWEPYLTPDGRAFDLLKLPLDLNQFKAYSRLLGVGGGRAAGMMLGAGIAVYADGSDVLSEAVNYTEFFRNESCGKCVPCRIGSQKLTELGTELIARRRSKKLSADKLDAARDVIETMSEAMVATSICSLGQVAPNPLATALEYFRDQLLAPPPEAKPRPAAPARPPAAPAAGS